MGLIFSMIDRMMDAFSLEEPSDHAEFYEDLNWRTRAIDKSIYGHSKGSRREQRALSYMLECARAEMLDMEWQLARSGSDSYKYTAMQMSEIQQELIELNKQNARLEAENEVLKEQIAYFRGHASSRAYKAAADQMHSAGNNPVKTGYEVIEVLNPVNVEPAQKEQPKQGTRYTSKTGATLQENRMAAAAYWENQYSVEEIAELLKLSPASVRAYLSTIKKHYKVELTQEGRMIQFDKEYGSVRWSLAFYERTNMKRVVNGE